MTTTESAVAAYRPDPDLDLWFERVVEVPPHLVWAAWTQPEHIKQWFTPAPWKTIDCEIDVRPGGIFRTVMQSPDGEVMDGGAGCILEAIENERLVWTSALGPGYRPLPDDDLAFTAIISIAPDGDGTRYRATAMHRDPEGARRHAEMGFEEGWGTAFDQLVELAKTF
jgi:uncharacterized protein YndB with AHSA1/START domain